MGRGDAIAPRQRGGGGGCTGVAGGEDGFEPGVLTGREGLLDDLARCFGREAIALFSREAVAVRAAAVDLDTFDDVVSLSLRSLGVEADRRFQVRVARIESCPRELFVEGGTRSGRIQRSVAPARITRQSRGPPGVYAFLTRIVTKSGGLMGQYYIHSPPSSVSQMTPLP